MEQRCQFHPLEPATYLCVECDINCCDECVDDSRFNSEPRCFRCNRTLEALGPGNIEPFWRRLQQSFRYPLATQSLWFILILSVLCSVAFYLPFALLIYLALFGSVFKYCLSCLSFTAEGYLTPPDITEAYEGGFRKMLVLIAMLFVTGLVVNLANTFLGSAIGGIVALLVTLSFPAIIIHYAISESMIESLNPRNIFDLIHSIGLPYGLILAFIFIMMGSVAVLYQLVAIIPSSLDAIFLFAITFYYAIVLHHLMGYMVFQFQAELGYSARLQDGSNKRRGSHAIAMAKISTLIKQAEFKDTTQLFQEQIRINPDKLSLHSRFFDFLLASKNHEAMTEFLPKYFRLLESNNRRDLISRNYKRLMGKCPDFVLEDPELKLLIAQASFDHNDARVAIKLLHGIHKKHTDFKDLIPALTLLAQALDEYPKYENHATACRKLIGKLDNAQ